MDHRKLLSDNCDCKPIGKRCHKPCHDHEKPTQLPPPSPPKRLPPFSSHSPAALQHNQNKLIVTGATVIASMLTTALLVGTLCAAVRLYFKQRRRLRRRSVPLFFGTQEDFLDEDRGPVPNLDNPIWYISTIGLQQSVIDSITVFKYKKDEGLIEGIDCSFCLNEFQEDESLRLLPKCSHAFHIPCIDTCLRSHKNCPLCRAPVVCEAMDAITLASESSEPNSFASDSRDEPQVDSSENYGVTEGGTSELRSRTTEDGNTTENSKKCMDHSKTRSFDSGVQSSDEVHQPIRRSVSMDLSSAMEIFSDIARLGVGVGAHNHRESLDTELQQIQYPKGKIVGKRSRNESSSISKLMKSLSIGRSLSKGPVSIKRSFSSGAKFLFSKRSRSQESIFPS